MYSVLGFGASGIGFRDGFRFEQREFALGFRGRVQGQDLRCRVL